MQSGEMTKDDRQTSSAQSTPSSTPYSSPKHKTRYSVPGRLLLPLVSYRLLRWELLQITLSSEGLSKG